VWIEPIQSSFEETVSARWRKRLAGVRATERRHWRTKIAYYTAVSRLLAGGVSRPAWFDVIDAVEPKGSRSTFYEVTGAHAKHSLISELLAEDCVDSLQLALYYRRNCAVDQLIDEAKVWTYWPYREFLRTRYERDPATDPVESAVEAWARSNPGLAAALDCAPPVCAVEDLLILQPGRYAPLHAVTRLTGIIRNATAELSERLVDAVV
jgi:hypothetical protein